MGRRYLVTLTVVSLVIPAASAPASGATGHRPQAPQAPSNRRNAYFAGWSYLEARTASVTAEFIVPALNCTSLNTGVALGSYAYTRQSASAAPRLSAADVQLFCLGGEPDLLAAVELGGRQSYGSQRPHPGDLIRATVADSATTLAVALQDLTAGHAFSLARSTAATSATSAAVGDVALTGPPSLTSGSVYPITDFGSAHFSAGRINGRPLGGGGGRAFDMGPARGALKINTSPLNGAGSPRTRDGFTTTWRSP